MSNEKVTINESPLTQNVARELGAAYNPMSALTERQRIALTSRWSGLKESEKDQYVHLQAQGLDSATLYAVYTLTADAETRIFSDMRASYLQTMIGNYMTLLSKEELLKKHAENQLQPVKDATSGPQAATLLSALKGKLLEGRTFMSEQTENGFRTICRFFGFDMNMIK
jgi:hypothetical protein